MTVVSGLARGVDAAAHRGALDAGGVTVGVCGCGADVVYPREHAGLARAIAAAGAIVSELAPGTPPQPQFFPLRNRIISGLSRAVVIVEAGEKSGSLITARAALEQGRDVLAVPGPVLGGRNKGAHALLRDGARIVETADDILEELGPSALLGPGFRRRTDGAPAHRGERRRRRKIRRSSAACRPARRAIWTRSRSDRGCRRRDCCRVCSRWSSPARSGAPAAAGSSGLTRRDRVKGHG